jgi:REP element-mobilizing transposase RayT
MKRTSEQLELGRSRWGGRRPGAGRKPGPNPRLRHRSRAPFGRGLPCHVTLKMRKDVPSLRTVALVREVEQTFARGCERGEFRVVHYSLQGDHAHLIVEAKDRYALGRGMKAIGARLARAVNRVFARSGPVLTERYHARVLRTPSEVRNALRYVLLNARRHAAKRGRTLSRALGIDPASSGRWFDGWRRSPDAVGRETRPSGIPAVSLPRSWLLSEGWRRRGLLDPSEVPGHERGAH